MTTSTTGERESDAEFVDRIRREYEGLEGDPSPAEMSRLIALACRASILEADVERVARALCIHDGYNPDETGDTHDCGVPKDWPLWRVYEAKARAALSAMPGSDYRAEMPQVVRDLAEAASELAQYASYSEMTGCISGNNPRWIRKWCDEVYRLHREYQIFCDSTSVPEPRDEGWRSQAATDVLSERKRQAEAEGWTPEHDDKHDRGEMANAAAVYAMRPTSRTIEFSYGDTIGRRLWPWHLEWWKPTDRRRDLVKAGALILAEIERLDRLSAKGPRS